MEHMRVCVFIEVHLTAVFSNSNSLPVFYGVEDRSMERGRVADTASVGCSRFADDLVRHDGVPGCVALERISLVDGFVQAERDEDVD